MRDGESRRAPRTDADEREGKTQGDSKTGVLDAAQLKIKLTVVLETAPGLVELSRRTCSFFWGQRMREGVGVAISGLKCPPRLGLGPRYNAERTPRPITYPPPPPLLVLYNPKRGTPCSGHLKIVPSEGAGVQKRDPQNTRQTPSKTLSKHFKKTYYFAPSSAPLALGSPFGGRSSRRSPHSAAPGAPARGCQLYF